MGKRKHNLTGHCQMCGEKLPPSSRADKMTCGSNSCTKKWTRFNKNVKGIDISIPKELERLKDVTRFPSSSYHMVEKALISYRELYDEIGRAIVEAENGQLTRAKDMNICHSVQFGFYSFTTNDKYK